MIMKSIKEITKSGMILTALFFTSCLQEFGQAEKVIQKDYLVPLVRTEVYPLSGKIAVNSPWMVWSPVIKEKKGYNTYKYDENYLYKVRISKDKSFQDHSTIESDLLEWTLFTPHKKLEKGTWYWKYASVDKTTKAENWSDPIKFEVTGEELEFVTPEFADIIKRIPKDHPRVLAHKSEIGKLNFPEDEKVRFLKAMDKKVNEDLPKSLIYNDQSILKEKRKKLKDIDYFRFIDKRTKEIYRGQKQEFEKVLKAYLVSGDQKFVEEALRRYYYLKVQYKDIVTHKVSNDFTDGFFYNVSAGIYDVCYDFLEEKEREEIRTTLVKVQEKTYHHFLHRAELYALDSHMWQFHLRTFLNTSLVLFHDVPQAEKWVEYVYNVWTMKAPAGSKYDGGWFTGNGYLDANKGSLLIMPVILSRLTGVNYFEHPWYRNVCAYLAFTAPVNHVAGSYGDNADIKMENAMDFVYALTSITKDPYGKMYTGLSSKFGNPNKRLSHKPADEESVLPMSLNEKGELYWYMYQKLPFDFKDNKGIEKPERARKFEDVGTVAAHTNLLNPEQNLMLSFRSSPFGVVGHSHACQNTFNIQYGGKPLFFRSGYYSSWADKHSLFSYRHTRAHNGILADGLGQPYTTQSYGWIARFATGDKLTYSLGDASNAYSGTLYRDEMDRMFKRFDVVANKETGFGDPGITKFRRHISMLEDDLIVIYDELEAKKPVEWSWLIHSKDTLALDDQVYYTENEKGKGKMWLFGSSDLQNEVTDEFFTPAIDWLGNGWKRGIEYTNQWHGTAKSQKMANYRFLSVIHVKNKKMEFTKLNVNDNGVFTINGWEIKAELDADKKASLSMRKSAIGMIHFGSGDLVYKNKTYKRSTKGSTILLEEQNGKIKKQEVVDELPHVAKYY